jgi:hypothetical protein
MALWCPLLLTVATTNFITPLKLPDDTEAWATFYDIFVENAFGNYRNIMQEVSASPLMGKYLTMRGNRAFADGGKFPDENYAREIMQLFSIGLWELNADGTPIIDSATGQYINAYSNEDIMTFARIWTGWNNQVVRGNVQHRNEGGGDNQIDPMQLKAEYRDRFPKTMIGGKAYLGDSYPLCAELVPQHYMKKDARFEYHGPISILGDLHDNVEKLPNIRDHFTPDSTKSQLYAALCSERNGKCTFPSVVTLDADLACNGEVECNADMLRVVKITDGDLWGYYTYIEPPCVRLQFFDDGRTAMNHHTRVCADPSVAANIGAQCCQTPEKVKEYCPEGSEYEKHWKGINGDLCKQPNGQWTCPVGCKTTDPAGVPYCILESDDTNSVACHLDLGRLVSSGGGECLYVAEPMKFTTAAARCETEYADGGVCSPEAAKAFIGGYSTADGLSKDWQATCGGFMLSWSTEPCTMQVQVYPAGDVAAVDRKGKIGFLKVNAGNKFKVLWGEAPPGEIGTFPMHTHNCTSGCQMLPDQGGSCLCDIAVDNEPFVATDANAELPTEAELRAALTLGASNPLHYGDKAPTGYTLCTTKQCTSRPGIRVHTRGTSNTPTEFLTTTIFEFTNAAQELRPSVRKPAKFLWNRVSTVHVGNTAEYKLLEVSEGIPVTCTGSSTEYNANNFVCRRAFDFNYNTEWAMKRQGVGGWISAELDDGEQLMDRLVYANRCNPLERAAVLQLDFSDGSSQNVTLSNDCNQNTYNLISPVRTSTVNITILTTYETNEWANLGARDIRFLVPGVVSPASSRPCEDMGLIDVTRAECEIASRHVEIPAGKTVGRGGVNSVGYWGHVPRACSMYGGEEAADWSPHWNIKEEHFNWQMKFIPVCKVDPATQTGLSKTGFQFRNPPHFVPNTGYIAHMPGGTRTANPYGDRDHYMATAHHETEALLNHLFEHANTYGDSFLDTKLQHNDGI